MKFLSLTAAALLIAGAAHAADVPGKKTPVVVEPPPSPWNLTFGTRFVTDYNFRGVSQTDRSVGVQGVAELSYDIFYVGAFMASLDLPTRPAGEFDIIWGIRPTWGPLSFDFGATYYFYPNEKQLFAVGTTPVSGPAGAALGGVPFSVRDTDYIEPLAKVSYTWNDMVTVGANVYYAPNYLNSGAYGTYLSGTAKIVLPNDFSISGEFAHYFFGRTNALLGNILIPEYNYWNVGVTYSYKSTVSLDVRYHGTDLSQRDCFTVSGDPRGISNGGRSRWCGDTVIATLSFDTSLKALGLIK